MTNTILVDTLWEDFLPLTFTRPVAELRVGALTLAEKWRHDLGSTISYHTKDYLQAIYPLQIYEDNLLINSRLLPTKYLLERVRRLQLGEALQSKEGFWVAARLGQKATTAFLAGQKDEDVVYRECAGDKLVVLLRPPDLFGVNFDEIERDFVRLTKGRETMDISSGNTVFGDQLFVEQGVEIRGAIIDATRPVYIGRGAKVLPGSSLMGPLSIGEGSVVKMGAKIYGGTTIGPHCKAGGEINNAIMMGYSNKGHDGYLGNSVLGEWCNLGADTNTSNLKNNYSEVRIWHYPTERFVATGKIFCGLIMGDHSKCGINTMFNTGTVVGVSANIYGAGYQRNFIPSFSWGGPKGIRTYRLDKALEVAGVVMKRRGKVLDPAMRHILENVFDRTEAFRPKG